MRTGNLQEKERGRDPLQADEVVLKGIVVGDKLFSRMLYIRGEEGKASK